MNQPRQEAIESQDAFEAYLHKGVDFDLVNEQETAKEEWRTSLERGSVYVLSEEGDELDHYIDSLEMSHDWG